MRQREYKLSLCGWYSFNFNWTTYILIYLPSLHNLLSLFGSLSWYKVNISKTEALPILLPPAVLDTLKQAYPYSWCTHSLKYLGVNLTPTYFALYNANYPPLFKEIQNMLKQWDTYAISWLGRINLLKMSILPKRLYLFETLPVPMPLSQLKVIHCWFLKLIWRNKANRIVRSVMFSPQTQGGLGAPDVIKYYYATHLRTTVFLV